MQVEFIINGGVSLMLAPENAMEEELLKGMMKQANELTEIRTTVTILNKSFKSGVLVHSSTKKSEIDGSKNEEVQELHQA
jgi:hypothetical protein